MDAGSFLFRDSRLDEEVQRMVDDVHTVYRIIDRIPLVSQAGQHDPEPRPHNDL